MHTSNMTMRMDRTTSTKNMRKRGLKRLQSVLSLTAAMVMTSHTATGFMQSPAGNHSPASLLQKTVITSHPTPTALSVYYFPGFYMGQDDEVKLEKKSDIRALKVASMDVGLEGVQALSTSQRNNGQEKVTFRAGSTLPQTIVTTRRFSNIPRSNEGKITSRPVSTIPERSITTRRFSNVPRSKGQTYA
jgi:hypothetical protein